MAALAFGSRYVCQTLGAAACGHAGLPFAEPLTRHPDNGSGTISLRALPSSGFFVGHCIFLNGASPGRMSLCAMAPEGTPGKWSLWATHPKRLGAVAELYPTTISVSARAADLRQAGYTVEVILSTSPLSKGPAP